MPNMDSAVGWYERYNIEKPNPHNGFIYVPDYITHSWPEPNYDNPESRALLTQVTEPLTFCLACVAISLRLFSRMTASKKLFREDYVILAAVFFCGLKTAIVAISTTVGFGIHRYDIPTENFRLLNKYYLLGILFYLASVMLTKASIILRYQRMFPPEVTHVRMISRIIVFFFFAVFTVSGILMINTCHPVPSLWSPESPGRCINVKILYICNIAGNFLVDFAIYLLPMPYLWKLNLPKRQKLNLIIIFGLGFSVCCIALGELVVSIKIQDEGLFDWTSASLPDLRSLITKFLPRFLSSSGASSQHHDVEAAGDSSQGQDLAIVNPAALAPEFADGNRGSRRISRPYWLRSQLEGSLFTNSIPSRRGSAVPNGDEDDITVAGVSKQVTGESKVNEKRVTMISEEGSNLGRNHESADAESEASSISRSIGTEKPEGVHTEKVSRE
ncbi:hypothetical protein ABW20_dc0108421 [Dactylellina cionopaga]|nr:hypothetical protein ABW20_dc0108421 [Dactylellina cionopaga]